MPLIRNGSDKVAVGASRQALPSLASASADDRWTAEFGRGLMRIEQVRGLAGSGQVVRLAAGRVRKGADRQADVVPELAVQVLGRGDGPGRQVDREWRLPALVHFRHWVLHQRAWLAVAQPGED